METQATPGQPQLGGECKLMSYFPSFSQAGPWKEGEKKLQTNQFLEQFLLASITFGYNNSWHYCSTALFTHRDFCRNSYLSKAK